MSARALLFHFALGLHLWLEPPLDARISWSTRDSNQLEHQRLRKAYEALEARAADLEEDLLRAQTAGCQQVPLLDGQGMVSAQQMQVTTFSAAPRHFEDRVVV